jgi:hypothetical protein
MKDEECLRALESSGLRDKSIATYKLVWRAWSSPALFGTDKLYTVLMKPNESVATLRKAVLQTKGLKAFIHHINFALSLFKHCQLKETHATEYQLWNSLTHKDREALREIMESNEPTDRQRRSMLSWDDDVMKRLDDLAYMEFGGEEHLLLSIYTLIPPRRQADYYQVWLLLSRGATMTAAEKQRYPAYIEKRIEENGSVAYYMVVNEYKTSKFHGAWEKKLPKTLLKVINTSLVKDGARDCLFVEKRSKKPFKNSHVFTLYSNSILKRIFANRSVSVNSLRHSFATKLRGMNLTVREYKAYAHDMGHSMLTNMIYSFQG